MVALVLLIKQACDVKLSSRQKEFLFICQGLPRCGSTPVKQLGKQKDTWAWPFQAALPSQTSFADVLQT